MEPSYEFKTNHGMFCQLDPAWNRLTLGRTPYTVKSWGCTTMDLILMVFLLTGKLIPPNKAVELFQYDATGQVYWQSVSNVAPNLKFMGRYGKEKKLLPPEETAEVYSQFDRGYGMLIELDRWPRHWVFCTKWGSKWWGYFLAYDPLTHTFSRFKRSEIHGFALYKRTDI